MLDYFWEKLKSQDHTPNIQPLILVIQTIKADSRDRTNNGLDLIIMYNVRPNNFRLQYGNETNLFHLCLRLLQLFTPTASALAATPRWSIVWSIHIASSERLSQVNYEYSQFGKARALEPSRLTVNEQATYLRTKLYTSAAGKESSFVINTLDSETQYDPKFKMA